MKETKFIAQNKEKWSQFEKEQDNKNADPEELGDLYAEITNDLSYAQSFYPNRTVRVYLNYLATRVHKQIFRQKPVLFKRYIQNWTIDIPLAIYKARKNLLFALGLFLLWAVLGAFLTHFNPDFAKVIMGSSYIRETENNIAMGNPMGIYGTMPQGSMFVYITMNNIKVAILCFVMGAIFSIGTHIIMFNNAIMLGVFQYFMKLKGILLTSFLAIWIHGAFEISAIVIASGAGFTIGHGLIFPGSYTRLQSLQISAKSGILIMSSLIPVFILAGFLESFVTRHYMILPVWSKWFIILFSFGIMIWYYVILPFKVAKKYPEKLNKRPDVKPIKHEKLQINAIKKTGRILREMFLLYRSNFSSFMKPILQLALPMIIAIVVFQNWRHQDNLNVGYDYDWIAQLSILFGNFHAVTFKSYIDIIISVLWVLPFTVIFSAVAYSFYNQLEPYRLSSFLMFFKKKGPSIGLATLIFLMILIHFPLWAMFLMVFIAPFLFQLIGNAMDAQDKFSLGKAFQLGKKEWSNTFVLGLLLVAMVFSFAQPFAFVFSFQDYNGEPVIADLLDLLTGFIERVLSTETANYVLITNLIRQIVYLAFLLFILPLLIFAFSLIYHSAKEKEDAIGLNEAFKSFGNKKKTNG
jgi:uncharacterized membrane protein SpoIIM required for sporulation